MADAYKAVIAEFPRSSSDVANLSGTLSVLGRPEESAEVCRKGLALESQE